MTATTPATALQNAAALMALLSSTEALAVFRTLPPEAARTLRNAMGKAADMMPRSALGGSIALSAHTNAQSQLTSDSAHYIRSLLTIALSDGDASLGANVVQQDGALKHPNRRQGEASASTQINTWSLPGDGSGIEKLKTLGAPAIADLLTNEHPQIIAAILVQVGNNLAANVLNNLPQRLCHQVVPRIASLQGIQHSAMHDLNEGILATLGAHDQAQFALQGGMNAVADILSMMDSGFTGGLLDSIRQQDPEMAHRLAQKMTGTTTIAAAR
jgi:flagellar motor switch protein FliG